MNKIADFINSEPVAFWTGAVGLAADAAVQYGLPINQDLKSLLILAVTATCAYIARGLVTPTK